MFYNNYVQNGLQKFLNEVFPMRIEQFEAILEVAAQKSMQKAAKNLYTSTQNVSKLIKDFEKELGVQVFVRNMHGVFATPEGEYIIQELTSVMQTINDLKNNYSNNTFDLSSTSNISHMRILSVPSEREIASSLLEYIEKKFHLQNIDLDIQDAIAISEKLKQAPADVMGNYDLVFAKFLAANSTYNPVPNENFCSFSLYKAPLCAHLSQQHKFAQKESVSIKELLNEPLIAYIPDGQKTNLSLLAVENIGVKLHPRHIIRSEQACTYFIQQNIGYSLVDYNKAIVSTIPEKTMYKPLKEKIFIYHVLLTSTEFSRSLYFLRIQNFLSKKYKYMQQLY